MTVRVGINGFGRIGRNFLRAVLDTGADVEVVGINDLTSAEMLAQPLALRLDPRAPLGAGRRRGRRPARSGTAASGSWPSASRARLPWDSLGVEVVIESTGHLHRPGARRRRTWAARCKRVIISGPSGDADATFVIGVNDERLRPRHATSVVSNASCTTNCFVPMVKVVDDAFDIVSGLMTTVHAYTNDQNLLDLPHKDLRRARAAAVNIVPTSTGAARATGLVLEAMKGRLDGHVAAGAGGGRLHHRLHRRGARARPSVAEVNAAFAEAAAKPPLDRVLDYTEDPIVSTDIVGSPGLVHLRPGLTMVQPIDRRAARWSRRSAGTTTSGATRTAWSTWRLVGRRAERRTSA